MENQLTNDAPQGIPSFNNETSATQASNVSLDDAFLTALKQWDSEQNPPSMSQDQLVQQDSPSTTQQVQDAPPASQLAPQDQVVQPESDVSLRRTDSETGQQSGDYRQLYEQVLKEKDAQMGLLYSRLNELSSQYQSLKQAQEAAPAAPVKTETKLAPEVQELYELYPEVAKAVEKLVESKTQVTPEVIEQVIADKAKPVTEQLKAVQMQQYAHYIMQKHPDLPQLLQSNALRGWVDTLDPIQKKGANYIMQFGTADEVISLIDTYKSKSIVVNQQQPSVPTSQKLVDKVVNAMNVPTSRQEPSLMSPQKPAYQSVNEAFDNLARDYESRYLR